MTLSDVKRALNIDFDDQDQYLTTLMNLAFSRAKSITGIDMDIITIETDMLEVYNAILEDVAAMYQNRGEKSTGSDSSLATYRRLSRRPML